MTKMFAIVLLTLLYAPQTARACGWSYESYHEEATALPCVYSVLLGEFPQHTNEYYEAQIKAADAALKWSPNWLEGLQLKGLALMKLSRLKEAEEVFLAHLSIDPDGYASHANLGTLYTFTGDFDKALTHIDAAVKIEPNAHFGREKYHRMLVVYLKDVSDPATYTKNFLGFSLTDKQRISGGADALKKIFTDNNIGEDAFDALSSMIAVYGAKDLAELYLAFGDLLALSGKPKLAWTAYQRAKELGHPRAAEIKKWQPKLIAQFSVSSSFLEKGGHHNIDTTYLMEKQSADTKLTSYQSWERKQLKAGLEAWSDKGFDIIYKEQLKRFKKCKTPGLVRDEVLTLDASSQPASSPAKEQP